MIIAATYENGNIYQHFGHTQQFKLYLVEDGKIKDSAVLGSGEAGHEALAGVLFNNNVSVLICGGIGPGAVQALSYSGITVCGGVSGNCDEAVAAFLEGKLAYSSSPNCNHHGHHGEEGEGGCGHHHHGEEGCGCHTEQEGSSEEGHCGCHTEGESSGHCGCH